MLKALFTASAVFALIQTSALAQTPEWMDAPKDFSDTDIQKNYSDWLNDKKVRAVESAATTRNLTESFDLFGPGVHAMSWSIAKKNKDGTREGGLSYSCIDDDPKAIPGPFAFNGMSPEDEARKCDWRLWQMDFAPLPDIATRWSSDALDLTTAKAWLRSKGFKPERFGKSTDVDWSGYSPLTADDEFRSVRSQTWSTKSCKGVVSVLTSLEAIKPVQIDIRKFGKEPAATGGAQTSDEYRSIKVQSGFHTVIEFSGPEGPGVDLTRQIDSVISECAPDS